MHTHNGAAAQLYLGSSRENAIAAGPRSFGSIAGAIRFAVEQAAPVSLHGALLVANGRRFGPAAIRDLHRAISLPGPETMPSRIA